MRTTKFFLALVNPRDRYHLATAHHRVGWKQEGAYHGKNIFTATRAVLFNNGVKQEKEGELTGSGSLGFAEK